MSDQNIKPPSNMLERYDIAEPSKYNKFKNKDALKWYDRFNILAFLFGPLYYAWKGMAAKGIALLGIGVGTVGLFGLMAVLLGKVDVENDFRFKIVEVWVFFLFAICANYDIWKLSRKGEVFWPKFRIFGGWRSSIVLFAGLFVVWVFQIELLDGQRLEKLPEDMRPIYTKVISACPGIDNHYDDLEFISSDANGMTPYDGELRAELKNMTVKIIKPIIYANGRANGHVCQFYLTQKEDRVLVMKDECASLCEGIEMSVNGETFEKKIVAE